MSQAQLPGAAMAPDDEIQTKDSQLEQNATSHQVSSGAEQTNKHCKDHQQSFRVETHDKKPSSKVEQGGNEESSEIESQEDWSEVEEEKTSQDDSSEVEESGKDSQEEWSGPEDRVRQASEESCSVEGQESQGEWSEMEDESQPSSLEDWSESEDKQSEEESVSGTLENSLNVGDSAEEDWYGKKNRVESEWVVEGKGDVENLHDETTDTTDTDSASECSDDVKYIDSQICKKNNISKDAAKAKPVLCFDEYGNLITSYEKPTERNMKVVNTTEKSSTSKKRGRKSLNFSRDEERLSDAVTNNGDVRNTRARGRPSQDTNAAPAVLSEQELKQAFKEELAECKTSRYGRARKRRTEDGFFFGTINFNELRKITSNTPKKSKGSCSKTSSPEGADKAPAVNKEDVKHVRGRLDEAMEQATYKSHTKQSASRPDSEGVNTVQNHQTKDDTEIVQIENTENIDDNSSSETGSLKEKLGEVEQSPVTESREKTEVAADQAAKSNAGSSSVSANKKSCSKQLLEHSEQQNAPEATPRKRKLYRHYVRGRLEIPLHTSDNPEQYQRVLRRRSEETRQKVSPTPEEEPRRQSRRSVVENPRHKPDETPSHGHNTSPQPPEVGGKQEGTASSKPLEVAGKQEGTASSKPLEVGGKQESTTSPQPSEVEGRQESTTSPQPSAVEGRQEDITTSQPPKTEGRQEETTSSQPPEIEGRQEGITSQQLPKIERRQAKGKRFKHFNEILSEEETGTAGECSSTTKSGRMVRKPDHMDVSIEDKRQRQCREQMRQSQTEAHGTTTLENELEAAGLDMRALEQEHPCEYLVGDLVWVHIRGSPLWPAMVTYHPRLGQYTRISVAHTWYRLRSVRLYHVQFFSDNAQTYWIAPMNVLPFDGLANLTDHLRSMKMEVKTIKKGKRLHLDSLLKTLTHIDKVTSGHKHERWIRAIQECDVALQLERYERIRKYAHEFPEIPSGESLGYRSALPRRRGRRRKHALIKRLDKLRLSMGDQSSGLVKRKRGRPRKYPRPEDLEMSRTKEESDDGEYSPVKVKTTFETRNGDLYKYSDKGCSSSTHQKWRYEKSSNSVKSRSKPVEENDTDSLKRKHVEDDDVEEESMTNKRKKVDGPSERGVYKVVRNEKVCYRCENVSSKGGSDMVRCKGLCCGVFHLECLGLSVQPKKDFKCEECVSGQHKCFICKSADGEKQRCSVAMCGKFYHTKCIQTWPQVGKSKQERFVCPRHICHMCAANADDMEDAVARTPPYTRCLRCPTTYHIGEECVAAGVEEVTQHHHVCTRHGTLPKTNVHHVNVNWCFCCSKGGSLLLCDQCPAAFHADCIKVTAPEGGYVCEDCENGKLPCYGDVVWVKLGNYRWWPAQVLHPKYIPDNIENLPHTQGMFCVHFFGSNDYYWITKGRTFHYQEGDKGSRAASSRTLEQQFQRSLDEAMEAYRALKVRRAQREAQRSERGNLKPPSYVKIDANRPVGNVRLSKLDLAAVNRCDCDPAAENPCGSDAKCLNRMLMFECMQEVCASGERCLNQRFQKKIYPKLTCFRTESRGWGLKTLEDLTTGQFIIEYVGELIDDDEFRRRIDRMHDTKEENYYFLTIDSSTMIDAGPKGNLARFMNHSCNPNCETQKWTVGGDTRVGLYALEDIPAGTELTFNYNLQCIGTEKKRCSCGAPQCSGFIGVKAQKSEAVRDAKKDKLAKRKRKGRRREVKVSEDECFRCGEHGDLILCDMSQCPKGYHLECLGLDKLPRGKWICPWHHCDECGYRSPRQNRCDLCPNSFCNQHLPGNLQILSGIGNFCLEHDAEELEALRGQMATAAVTDDEHELERPPTLTVQVTDCQAAQPDTCLDTIAQDQCDSEEKRESSDMKVSGSSSTPGVLSVNGVRRGLAGMDARRTRNGVLASLKGLGDNLRTRVGKAPDGPENSSAVMNVDGEVDKGSKVSSTWQKVLRKGVRVKSTTKPLNEA